MPNGGPELTNDGNHTSKSRLVVLSYVRVGTSYSGMLLTRLGWFRKHRAQFKRRDVVKPRSLPTIDARYWTAILAASMCGANTGDFVSRILGLGHTRGLLPLGLIFLAIVWAETRSKLPTEAYYWLAIIVLRTGATNLADLGTHDLKLGYFLFMGVLTALIVAMLLLDRVRGVQPIGVAGPDGRWHTLPATDASYWITMLAAGTLGTAAGDWVAEETGLGLGYGSALLVAALFGI